MSHSPSSTPARLPLAPAALGIALLVVAGSAQAQFGGFLQGVLNAATQQAGQQAAQQAAAQAAAAAITGQPVAPAAAPVAMLTPAQTNAIAATAAAIPTNDPEYQSLMMQSLASVPANQRATLAPVIDMQVRQSIASRRLGYNAAPVAGAPGVTASTVNPIAQQAVQNALTQGLAGRGNYYAPGLAGDAGKAAAAGALIQGLGSLFSRSNDAPATSAAPESPAPAVAP